MIRDPSDGSVREKQKSAPPALNSLSSGESGPAVTPDLGGADTFSGLQTGKQEISPTGLSPLPSGEGDPSVTLDYRGADTCMPGSNPGIVSKLSEIPTVSEKPETHQAIDSGLQTGSSRPGEIERLNKSREWLREFHRIQSDTETAEILIDHPNTGRD